MTTRTTSDPLLLQDLFAEWKRAGANAPVLFTLDDERSSKPSKGYGGDAGFDLFCSKRVTISPRQFSDLPTGLHITMPTGLWGRITGRSSALRKYGLLISEGVIDNGYRGELFTGAFNLTDGFVTIEAGTRLAQIIFHQIYSPYWVKVDVLPGSERGSNGFGSTGR